MLGRVGESCSNTLLLTLLTFTAFITSQTAPPAIGAIMLTSSAPSYTWQLSSPCVTCLGVTSCAQFSFAVVYNFSNRYAITIQFLLHGATHIVQYIQYVYWAKSGVYTPYVVHMHTNIALHISLP